MANQQHNYRKYLLKSLMELEGTVDNLNLIILNLAMNGEWKEVDALIRKEINRFIVESDDELPY